MNEKVLVVSGITFWLRTRSIKQELRHCSGEENHQLSRKHYVRELL
jgi:hypothetical protein